MKKNFKYIKMTPEMFEDHILVSFLEQQAQEGWIFSQVTDYLLLFKKEQPQLLKYQWSYQKMDDEFKQVIMALGYRVVCHIDGMSILVSDNLQAEELYDDEQSKYMAMAKHHSYAVMILLLLAGLAAFWVFFHPYVLDISLYSKKLSLGQLCLNLLRYMKVLYTSGLFGLYALTSGIYMLYMRLYLNQIIKENGHPSGKLLLRGLKIKTCLKNIYNAFLVLIAGVFAAAYMPLKISQLFAYFAMIIYLIYRFCFYHWAEHFHRRHVALGLCLGALILGTVVSKQMVIAEIEQPLYFEKNIEEVHIHEWSDLLTRYRYVERFDGKNDIDERYVVCLNEAIARIVFQEEIQSLASADHSQIKGVELLDDFYANDVYVVGRKENRVLVFRYRDTAEIEKIIHYYFE